MITCRDGIATSSFGGYRCPSMQPNAAPPVALTIAGSDNSAGAGAQADLKTFSALGVYGLTAVTCVVAEVPGKVSAIQPIEPQIVAEQIRLCFEAYPVGAVKTGMLYSTEIMEAVCAELAKIHVPIVVDPVMVATSGAPLLKAEAVALYRDRLFAMASVVTPNLDEVATLLGRKVVSLEAMREAGAELTERFGVPFLVKGGHLRGETAVDLLFYNHGIHEYPAPFVHGVSTHGTGCTYAAGIAAGLAKGLEIPAAVGEAKQLVTRAVSGHLRWQRRDGVATDALDHFA